MQQAEEWNIFKQAYGELFKVSRMSFLTVYIKITTSVKFSLSHAFSV